MWTSGRAKTVLPGCSTAAHVRNTVQPPGGHQLPPVSRLDTNRGARSDRPGRSEQDRSPADLERHSGSRDTPLDDEDGGAATLGDLQPDPAAAGEMLEVEEKLYHEQLHDALEEAMEKLTTQEGEVLRRIYYAGHTLQQISADEGISFQRVQQIKNTAFRKLRNNPRLRRWRDEVISSHAWHGTSFTAWAHCGSVEERTVEYLEAHGAYCVR